MILLRWIFGVLNGAIGAPAEPLWMFFDPRVVGRALKSDIKCDFHPALSGFFEILLEVIKAAKCGED